MVQLTSLVALISFFLLSSLSQAYVFDRDSRSGYPVRLNVTPANPTVIFSVSGDAPAFKNKDAFLGGKYNQLSDLEFFRELVREAMKRWNDVEDSFVELSLSPSPGPGKDPKDKIHTIGFSPGSWSDAGSAQPTRGESEADSRYIVDCDIILDESDDVNALAHTVLHELGHCLGLLHPHYSTKAVMSYATSQSFRNRFELALDDIAGVTVLYPLSYQSRKNIIPMCGNIARKESDNTTHTPARACLLLLLLLPFSIPILRKRSRRQRSENARF